MRKSKGKVLKRVCTLALSGVLVVGSIYQMPNGIKTKNESVSAAENVIYYNTYGDVKFGFKRGKVTNLNFCQPEAPSISAAS